MKSNHKKQVGLFFLFWAIALAFYFPTSGAGFVTDQVGWLEMYQKLGWEGIFVAFQDQSLHYFCHLAAFTLWKIAGMNGYCWMFFFVTVHSLNAWLSYLIFNRLFARAGVQSAKYISIAGSLLFLLSPYQSEPLCWYACIHYPLCVMLVLLAFRYFILYMEYGEKKNILFFYLAFIVSLFTLELSFSLPLILSVFVLLFPIDNFKINNKLRLFTFFIFPSFACLAIYFLLSKLILGSATGHYGSSTHLNFSIPLIIGNLIRYILKVFAFAQFFPYEYRGVIYDFVGKPKVAYIVLIAFVLLALLVIIYKNKIPVRWRITGMLFAFFALGLCVILNLYFTTLIFIEGDRFTYLALLFAGQLIAFFLPTFLKKAGWLLVIIYFLTGCYFLYQNTQSWKTNNEIRMSLESSFKWYDARKIYILNLPDNYKGTYMYRDFADGNSFAETIKFKTGRDIIAKTPVICEFNMQTLTDSVKVKRLAADSVKLEFAQYGNWWWRGGVGESSYSTNDYDLDTREWLVNIIHFKHLQKGDVIIYQCGKEWRELKQP